MGLLADIQALSADSTAAATAQGGVATAQAALATAQAAAAAAATTTTQADATVAADLAAPPYNGQAFIPDPNAAGNVLVYSVNSAPPGFAIVSVPPAT